MIKNYMHQKSGTKSTKEFWNKYWSKIDVKKELSSLKLYYNKQAIENFLPKSGRVLECGCGTGRLLFAFDSPTRQMVGLEIVDEPLERIRAVRPDLELHVGNVLKLPFSTNSFDACIALGVLSWLKTPEEISQALLEIRRVCRPGAKIIISFPADNMYLRLSRVKSFFSNKFKNQYEGKEHSGYYFTYYDLYKFLNDASFKLKKVRAEWPMMGLWFSLPFLRTKRSNEFYKKNRSAFLQLGRDGVSSYELTFFGKFLYKIFHPFSWLFFSVGIMSFSVLQKDD